MRTDFIAKESCKAGEPPGALADALPLNAEQLKEAQQHVRRLLSGVVWKHHVTVSP
jgi:hypothetical protein